MSFPSSLACLLRTAALLGGALLALVSPRLLALGWHADVLSVELAGVNHLPPLPEGVTELKFSELYKTPIGPRGLEPTTKLTSLAGRRVRLLGFMAKQTRPSPGVAILGPYAMATNENEYGLADDFPPSVVFVLVPRYEDIAVPHTPGPLLLTGTLEVGRREEADGRVSFVRLRLDDELPAAPEPVPAAANSTPTSAPSPASAVDPTATTPAVAATPAR